MALVTSDVSSMQVEEIKVKAHYRKHPNGVRAELAHLQQISRTSKARLTSAEQVMQRPMPQNMDCTPTGWP